MARVFEDRPEREPDVIIPAATDYCKVEVWVEEKRFYMRGYIHDTIASHNIGLEATNDPIVYFNAIIEAYQSGDDTLRERAEPAITYLLEREILRED